MVDWSKPIEAVHDVTGEVVHVAHVESDKHGRRKIIPPVDGCWWFNSDGKHGVEDAAWSVRNVAMASQHPSEPHQASKGASGYDEALIERMALLCREMAGADAGDTKQQWSNHVEARAIVAEMAPVVEEEAESEANRIVDELMPAGGEIMFDSWQWKAMVACYRRGREHAAHLRLHAKGGTR